MTDLIDSSASAVEAGIRPSVRGKFIYHGERKLLVRGVTYGPFRPNDEGSEYHTPEVVDRDFAEMARRGINTVRTYTVPPPWLLDLAHRHGLYVMVGLPWEQHITFLDDSKRVEAIVDSVREGVTFHAGHPALLAYAIGNEIPGPIVRWYGRARVERFLERLYRAAKTCDPGALITYVNYPTTEYLLLPFLDFCCFNVYLESEESLEAYLARLQNLAEDKPLVMAEIGLDSRRNGLDVQAETLEWQIQTVFGAGSAGLFVFAWTDEWYRGGFDIEDWDFGLTDRDRRPKPALEAVSGAYAQVPFPSGMAWPRVSVVICSYNGARTIGDTLEGLTTLDYPDYEVIVVSDGSVDATEEIARQYDVKLISTENRGLSSARNTGMMAATGDIVAYIDDDARPDPHWLQYLAAIFMQSSHAGVGGPNLAPPGDGAVAECVANAPGGPVHVLLNDTRAEHIPGCNMAFWRSNLQEVGGFDARFRIAGDDVDLCWRMEKQGWTLGFHPAAMVWHHRRNSVKAYWKQQLNYGKAEGMLEMKWPEKYNSLGHLTWRGRLYGTGLSRALLFRRWRVYHGVWGSGLFQSIYEVVPGRLSSLPLMPEWYLVIAGLLALSMLGILWPPMLLAIPLVAMAIFIVLIQSYDNAGHSSFAFGCTPASSKFKLRLMTSFLYVIQPLARLLGRLRYGLTPWRRRGKPHFAFPRSRLHLVWSESWKAQEARVASLERAIRNQGAVVGRGGEFDRWDLQIRGGLFGSVRTRVVVEEHGAGKQLVRLHSWPRFDLPALAVIVPFALLGVLASFDQAWVVAAILFAVALALVLAAVFDGAAATASYVYALKQDCAGGGTVLSERDKLPVDSTLKEVRPAGVGELAARSEVGRG